MKPFLFGLCSLFVFSSFTSAQTLSKTSQKKDAVVYQSAWLTRMTASADTQTHELSHTTVRDSVIVEEKIVTYHFFVRSGGVEYTSKYTPDDQPGNLPDAWWKGNALVGIRVVNHKLYLKLPDGREVESIIIGHNPITKSS